MGEQKPRKPIGSHWGNHDSGLAQRPQQSEPRKIISSYYGQAASPVILGLDTLTNQPISVSQVDLCSGTYIVGVQGMGKTSLLEQIVYQQMQTNEAIIVIDPHGDLVNSIIYHMPERRLSKTYLLDLKEREYPFGLSVFACSNPADEEERDTTRNQIMHAFEKLWPETKEGQYFKKILRHVVITLIENPTLTLANVRRLLLDDEYRQQYTTHLQNTETRSFWHDEYNRLSESKQTTQTNPFLGRLDELLTEPVIKHMLQQTTKTLDIRELIEERGILLVKLPVNEEAYKYSAPVVGTLLMAMIYAAIFSFADLPLEHRPGCTLVVDEFQNFATDEYAKLFEQGRKYKVKQFLAHQHRQQFERGDTGKTNLAATLSAHTIVAFRTIPNDSKEIASLFIGIDKNRRPTDFYMYPTEKLYQHKNPTIKQFTRDIVDKLDKASGEKLVTKRGSYIDYLGTPKRFSSMNWDTGLIERESHYPLKHYTYKENPVFDFGEGEVETSPAHAEHALTLLDTLIYESEEHGQIAKQQRDEFLQSVAPFWKFENYINGAYDNAEERERYLPFARSLDTALSILIREPIAQDATLNSSDIAKLLEHQQKRHALVKSGSLAFQMETRDTRLLQDRTTAQEAAQRLTQVREQTRARYCVARSDLDERETEEIETKTLAWEEEDRERIPGREREAPQPKPVEILPPEPEPIVAPEPEPEQSETVAKTTVSQTPEPEHVPPQPILTGRDKLNRLYIQLKEREIDPDTTILAALGEHYVLTIRQWMRLFERSALPKATPYFKTLREQGYIFRKDREGRGGALVTGDWFFLLTKGGNELVRRKQPAPIFKLEPNEAERAAGDTLVHTSLVNEILIHIRLLERQYPGIITIERIDHERSMRREYLPALGSDSKLYPDGFLRILVPTPNGLRKRYLFFELQHSTQKDKQNWQAKVRKYLDLFTHEITLTHYFATRTPRVLVLVMDEEYIAYHKQWTEEVLQQQGDKGKGYSNRFLIGSYDTGIADNTTQPLKFFCTPRFFVPFTDTTYPLFYRVK